MTKNDILLEQELKELVEKHSEQFRVYHVLNQAPEGWTQGVGFISKQILQEKLPLPANDIKILVCGPPPLVKAVTNVSTTRTLQII